MIVGAPEYDLTEKDQGVFFLYMGSSNGLNTIGTSFSGPTQEEARFGNTLSSAGDVNGDGYSDIIVASVPYAAKTKGGVYLYYGSQIGLSNPVLLESSLKDDLFGYAVAGAGDINADGYSDLIIGAYNYTYKSPVQHNGVAFIYFGSSSGIPQVPADTLSVDNPGVLGALFGTSVASAGDVNGDGFSDVIVGAIQYMNGNDVDSFTGAAYIFHGSNVGLPEKPSLFIKGNVTPGGHFGAKVCSMGDANGDGFSDVMIGSDVQSTSIYYAAGDGFGH